MVSSGTYFLINREAIGQIEQPRGYAIHHFSSQDQN